MGITTKHEYTLLSGTHVKDRVRYVAGTENNKLTLTEEEASRFSDGRLRKEGEKVEEKPAPSPPTAEVNDPGAAGPITADGKPITTTEVNIPTAESTTSSKTAATATSKKERDLKA